MKIWIIMPEPMLLRFLAACGVRLLAHRWRCHSKSFYFCLLEGIIVSNTYYKIYAIENGIFFVFIRKIAN